MDHCDGFSNGFPSGWSTASENVAAGQTPDTVVTSWMGSSGHRANILTTNVNRMGVGYMVASDGTAYFTQNFGAYSSTQTVPAWVGTITANPSTSANTVDVAWAPSIYNGNSPITGYKIIATPSNGGSPVVQSAPATVNNHVLTGLAGGTEYSVQVVPVNNIGEGIASPITTVTPIGVPTVTIGAIDSNPYGFTINWTGTEHGTPITGYKIATGQLGNIDLPASATSHIFEEGTPGQYVSGTVTVTSVLGNSEPVPFSLQLPAVAPDAATASAVVENKTNLRVDWIEPDFDGGAQITGYVVNLYDGATLVADISVNGNTFSTLFEGLTRGTEYHYEVVATNSAGSTPSANTTTITLPYTAPTAVQTATAELTDEQTITLNWVTPVDNGGVALTNYVIDVIKNGTKVNTQTIAGDVETYTFNNTVIDPSSTYTFVIHAVNPYFAGSNTSTNQVTVPAIPVAPGAVANLDVTNITSDEGFLILWDAPTDNGGAAVTNYEWEVYKTDKPTEGDSGSTADTQVQLDWSDPGTNYTVRVRAENRKGLGAWAETLITTLANPTSTPYLVTPFGATTPTTGILQVGVIDDGGDPNITYTVDIYDTTDEISLPTLSTTSQAEGKVNITGLLSGHTYSATVTATNSGGISDAGSFLFSAPAVSDAVTNLVSSYSNDEIVTEWVAPVDTGGYSLTGYIIEYTDAVNNAPIYDVTVDAGTTEHTATLTETSDLQWGNSYVVTVIPVTGTFNLKGENADINVTIPPRVPFPVKNLHVTVNTGSVDVEWEAPTNNGGADINGYYVTLYDADTNANILSDASITTARNIELPKNNKNYYITVAARNSAGFGDTNQQPQFNSGNFVPTAPDVTLTVEPTTGEVTVNTTVTDDGGTAITNYIHTVYNVTDDVVVVPETETTTGTTTFDGEFGKTYSVTAKLRNSMGVSGSTTQTVTVPVTNPDKVTNVTSTPTVNGVTVTWENPAFTGGHGTQIETVTFTLTPTDGGDTVSITVPADELSATFSQLVEFTDYVIKIKVTNGNGLASTETSHDFTTLLAPANAPTNGNITVAGTVGTVTWDASTGAPANAESRLRYNVSVNNADTGANIGVLTSIATPSVNFINLPKGVNVNATISAYYTGVQGTTSPILTTNTVMVPVTAPTVARNLQLDWDSLLLTASWLAPTDNGGAPVEYDIVLFTPDDDVIIEETTTSELSYSFEELEPNTSYTLAITATNTVGSSEPTRTSFTTALVAPTAPLNVVSEATDRNIVTSWDVPASSGGGTLTYDVKVWEVNPDGADKVMDTATVVNGEEYSFNGTTRGETYYVTVVAVNTAGTSPTATSNDVFIIPVAPSKVTGITATVTTDNQVVVNWVAPVDNGGSKITGYNVVVENVNGEEKFTTLNIQNTTVTIPVGTLNPNVEYTVFVQAVTGYGTSVEESNFTTNIITPTVPQNVKLTVNQTDAVLSASFDAVENNGGDDNLTYTARLFTADGTQIWENLNATPGTTEILGTFPRGVGYSYTVEAVNHAGNSPVVTDTVTIDAIVPSNPTNLIVTDTSTLTEASTEISWTTPGYNGGATITGYNWTLLEGTTRVDEGTVTGTTVTLNNLTPNKVYSIQITVVNRVGESTPLEGINTVITPVILPEEGTITTTSTSDSISFIATVNNTGGDVTTNVTTRVELFTEDNLDTPIEVITGENDGVTGTFTGLTHATSYVLQYNIGNTVGETSTTVNVKTAPVASNAVTNVNATIAGPASANVSWTAPTDDGGAPVASYIVEWSNVDGSVTGNVTVTAPVSKTTVGNLPAGNLFTFTVTAVNSAGNSPVSDASSEVETVPATNPTLLDEETFISLLDGLVKLDVTITGNVANVTVPVEWNDEWFYGATYSTPIGIGWDYVKNGNLTYTLPVGLEAGDHHVAVYDNTGTIIGAAEFTIAETIVETPVDNGNNGKGETTTGGSDDTKQTVTGTNVEKAENTGGSDNQFNWILWLSIAVLLAGGGIVLVTTRNRSKEAVKETV